MNKYADIINYNYTGSLVRKHMSIYERSASFAPFAALTGYDDAIYEKGRLVDSKINLTDDEKEFISNKINLSIGKEILVTYFVSDKYKDGGSYLNYTGIVRTIDFVNKIIFFNDKNKISINDIILVDFVNN